MTHAKLEETELVSIKNYMQNENVLLPMWVFSDTPLLHSRLILFTSAPTHVLLLFMMKISYFHPFQTGTFL